MKIVNNIGHFSLTFIIPSSFFFNTGYFSTKTIYLTRNCMDCPNQESHSATTTTTRTKPELAVGNNVYLLLFNDISNISCVYDNTVTFTNNICVCNDVHITVSNFTFTTISVFTQLSDHHPPPPFSLSCTQSTRQMLISISNHCLASFSSNFYDTTFFLYPLCVHIMHVILISTIFIAMGFFASHLYTLYSVQFHVPNVRTVQFFDIFFFSFFHLPSFYPFSTPPFVRRKFSPPANFIYHPPAPPLTIFRHTVAKYALMQCSTAHFYSFFGAGEKKKTLRQNY